MTCNCASDVSSIQAALWSFWNFSAILGLTRETGVFARKLCAKVSKRALPYILMVLTLVLANVLRGRD